MSFLKYQHLERFGTDEVEGIELGTCYVFPKVDGTNASVWFEDGEIKAGSRRRQLTLDNDNAGFYAWASQDKYLQDFFTEHPSIRLFGEWLVPHSLKTYRDDAWRKFYVFDMVTPEGNYLHYETLQMFCEESALDYIPPLRVIKNGNLEMFTKLLAINDYLIEDGKGSGEGIVIKNYDFVNKYGRVTWAKIVTSEFKEKHHKNMGAPSMTGKSMIEQAIAEKYVTPALVEKTYEKIKLENGWNSKMIPRLLSTVYHEVITEETWHFIKEHKNPTINFRDLQKFVILQIKQARPELF